MENENEPKTLSLANGQVLGTLVKSPAGAWVTYNEAKEQVRAVGKNLGLKLGTFEPRANSRNTLKVPVKDGVSNAVVGFLTAERRVDAPITFITATQPQDLPADVLEQVMADEAKGQLKLQTQVGMG